MEQGDVTIGQDLDGDSEVRKYLLGMLGDLVKMRQIEQQLLVDDQFAEELTIAEDQLIEEYLDGELSTTEEQRFLSHFLVSNDRRERVSLARNLRKYAQNAKTAAVTESGVAPGSETVEESAELVLQPAAENGRSFDWRRYFSMPAVGFAAAALLVAIVGFGVWRVAFYESDVDRGLAQLKLAYKGDRPFDARIVGFDHAPPPAETRGGKENKAPSLERDRANGTLEKAMADSRTARSLYGMGKASLAKKDFEKAIPYLEEAAKLDPANADIQSDLGTAYLEKGKNTSKDNSAQGLELLDKGRKHLERSIELNPKLLEPRFNRALSLEALVQPDQAKKAWLEYIQIDPASPWTDEARSRLKDLEEKSTAP